MSDIITSVEPLPPHQSKKRDSLKQLPQNTVSRRGIHKACLSPAKTRLHHAHPLKINAKHMKWIKLNDFADKQYASER